MRNTERDAAITQAIVNWIVARDRAQGCRTISSALAQCQEYGVPLHAQPATPGIPALGLLEAERVVLGLADWERTFLLTKYGPPYRQVTVQRPHRHNRGVIIAYTRAAWKGDADVARLCGWSVHEMRAQLTRIRELVGRALDAVNACSHNTWK